LATAQFRANSAFMPGASILLGEHTENFRVVADLQDFMLAVSGAQAELIGKFAAATAKLNTAAGAFRRAQETQQKALSAVAGAEKMGDDLLWGALFAVLGGLAGGAAGSSLKSTLQTMEPKIDAVAIDGLTDSGKDFVKFSIRSLDKLRGAGTSTKGDSTSSSVRPEAEAHGKEKASGKSPFDFLTNCAAVIESDKVVVQGRLAEMIAAAREARNANSIVDFDEDPMAIATKRSEVDQISSELGAGEAYYAKGLWESWLKNYGYEVASGWANAYSDNPHPLSQRQQPIRDAICVAAGGREAGHAWVVAYAPAPAPTQGPRPPSR
jgi:hypothetical protein